jgi:hypothetical protein
VKNDLPLTSVSVGDTPLRLEVNIPVALRGENMVAAIGSSDKLLKGYI